MNLFLKIISWSTRIRIKQFQNVSDSLKIRKLKNKKWLTELDAHGSHFRSDNDISGRTQVIDPPLSDWPPLIFTTRLTEICLCSEPKLADIWDRQNVTWGQAGSYHLGVDFEDFWLGVRSNHVTWGRFRRFLTWGQAGSCHLGSISMTFDLGSE